MNPDKAEALAILGEVSRELDGEMRRLRDVARSPGRNGWTNSFQALATLSALGLAAVVVDFCEVGFRRIRDARWEP